MEEREWLLSTKPSSLDEQLLRNAWWEALLQQNKNYSASPSWEMRLHIVHALRWDFGKHKVENGQSCNPQHLPSPQQIQQGKQKANTHHHVSARANHSLADPIPAPRGEVVHCYTTGTCLHKKQISHRCLISQKTRRSCQTSACAYNQPRLYLNQWPRGERPVPHYQSPETCDPLKTVSSW